MLTISAGAVLRIAVALGVAGASLGASDGRYEDERSLQQACAGLPTSRATEDLLSNVRAVSNGGFDPICAQSP